MAAPSDILFLNDLDAYGEFGFYTSKVLDLPGILGGAPRDIGVLTAPERDGGVVDRVVTQPGTGRIEGFFDAVDQATAQAKFDAMRSMLGEGEVRVRSIYAPDRHCFSVLDRQEGAPLGPLVDGGCSATFSFIVPSGVAVRRALDKYALSTARTSCPVGTADSDPYFSIHGNGSPLTGPILITVKNAAGVAVQTMTLSTTSLSGGVLGANDYLLIDVARTAITKSLAGTKSDAQILWTAGDFPVLRSADARFAESLWPSVALSSAAGTPVGQITYPRRYR